MNGITGSIAGSPPAYARKAGLRRGGRTEMRLIETGLPRVRAGLRCPQPYPATTVTSSSRAR